MRPVRDVYAVGPGAGLAAGSPIRGGSPPPARAPRSTSRSTGTTGLPGVLGGLVDQVVLRRRVLRAMQAHLDAYAAAAARRALDVRAGRGRGDRRRRPRAGRPAVGRAVRRLLGVPRRQGRAGGVATCRRWSGRSARSSASRSCPRRSSVRCCWTASSAAGPRARRPCGSGGRGSPTAGCPWRTSTPQLRWVRRRRARRPRLDPGRPAPAARRPRPPAPPLTTLQLSVPKAGRGGSAFGTES